MGLDLEAAAKLLQQEPLAFRTSVEAAVKEEDEAMALAFEATYSMSTRTVKQQPPAICAILVPDTVLQDFDFSSGEVSQGSREAQSAVVRVLVFLGLGSVISCTEVNTKDGGTTGSAQIAVKSFFSQRALSLVK